jgi:uncharacterized cupredoxin-like copper-binding protein
LTRETLVRYARRTAIGVLAAAALGAGGYAATGLAAGNLSLRATGFSSFSTKSLSTTAGRVTITMTNRNSLRHNISLKGRGIATVRGRVVGTGKTSTISVTLKRGKYTFFCAVPGHEAAGMRGTLTVR